jgi:hypothetical protein
MKNQSKVKKVIITVLLVLAWTSLSIIRTEYFDETSLHTIAAIVVLVTGLGSLFLLSKIWPGHLTIHK